MSPDVLRNVLACMKADEREELAKSMVSPVRCGGLNYDENGPYYLVAGKRLSPAEFQELSERLAKGVE